jgi:hypothetical protein
MAAARGWSNEPGKNEVKYALAPLGSTISQKPSGCELIEFGQAL